MKKAILSIVALSALGFSIASHAAPTVGATGMINFNGSINADSCVVHGNGASSAGGSVLNYPMGSVSVNALGTEAAPATAASGVATTLPVALNLQLECATGTSVELKLTPTVTVGKGIGVSGGAQNVQIMLMQGSTALDFAGGPVTLEAPLSGGQASVGLNAYYTLQAAKNVADVVTGDANGSVAYVLSYN
ncbi:type 1 fimbrial protein [Comamonas sp.]|uniref:fimbrial protein n=1 Tax=Comamonas sp. TaxID=34028 RepID=UPI0012C47EE5|nr:type 1 fimbrial protein [Comamonas sp.]MPS95530.1 type 1 fimbrial protein [Comamonas sp.]